MTWGPLPFELTEGHASDDIELDELPVYQLIDGRRTVQEIVDGSLLGRYAACTILVELLQDGIIKLGASKATLAPEQYSSVIDRVLGPGVYMLLALLLIAALFLPTGFPISIMPAVVGHNHSQSHLAACFDSFDLQRTQYALEAFYCKKAQYPQSLMELVSSGLISADCISETVHYVKKRMHYELGVVAP